MWVIDPAVRCGGTAVFAVRGRLDLRTADQLPAAVASALTTTRERILIDLTECSFVDSTGLGALVAAFKIADRAGVEVRLAGVGARVHLLLERTNLSRLFPDGAPPPPHRSRGEQDGTDHADAA